jgi:hypothetical protein
VAAHLLHHDIKRDTGPLLATLCWCVALRRTHGPQRQGFTRASAHSVTRK